MEGFCFLFLCFFIFKDFLFYFWLCWIFVSGGGSLVELRGTLGCVQWLPLPQSTGSRHARCSSCSSWAQQLWCIGFAAPWHVGSSQTRDETCVPCIGRWILNHWAIREALFAFFFFFSNHLRGSILQSSLQTIQALVSQSETQTFQDIPRGQVTVPRSAHSSYAASL